MIETTRTELKLAYSRGFDRGNYASAYEFEPDRCDPAGLEEHVDKAIGAQSSEVRKAFGAGYIIGLWSSYEDSEIPWEDWREVRAEAVRWAKSRDLG